MSSLFSKKNVFKQNKTQPTTISMRLSALKLCETKTIQHAYTCATNYLAKEEIKPNRINILIFFAFCIALI